jgi:membrane protease YdiL (CAAX protease family)
MRHTLRFAAFLTVGIFAVCLLTPFATALVEATGINVPAHRVWHRLALAGLVISAFLAAPRSSSLRDDELPFRPLTGWKQETARGFAAGLSLCILLVCWLVLQGKMHFSMEFNWADDGLKFFLIVPISAVTVAFLEEWVFRHLVFTTCNRDGGTVYAVMTTSLLFGAVHFFNLPRDSPRVEPSIFSGFVILKEMLANVLIVEEQLAFVGLFLTGLVLALARVLTGRLFLAMGLHASFVFFNRLDGPFTSWNVQEHSIWTGGRHYTAGFPGWMALLTLCGVLLLLVRRRERQTAPGTRRLAIQAASFRTSSPQERP